MPRMKKVIRVTRAQMDSLLNGDPINGEYYDSNTLYLIDQELISRPNLIVNPDFAINQRGQVQYNTTGRSFDRWQITNTGLTVTKIGDHIMISNTSSSDRYLRQSFPHWEDFIGEEVCFQVRGRTSSGTPGSFQVCTYTWNYDDDDGDGEMIIGSVTIPSSSNMELVDGWADSPDLYPESGWTNEYYVRFKIPANTTMFIEWVKLEYGEYPTPYQIPNYDEELLKCQRYYVYYKDIWTHGFLTNSGKNYYININTPIPMGSSWSIDSTNYTPTFTVYVKNSSSAVNSTFTSKIGSNKNLVDTSTHTISILNPYNTCPIIGLIYTTAPGDTNNTMFLCHIKNLGIGSSSY